VFPKLGHAACGTVPNIHQHHNNLIYWIILSTDEPLHRFLQDRLQCVHSGAHIQLTRTSWSGLF